MSTDLDTWAQAKSFGGFSFNLSQISAVVLPLNISYELQVLFLITKEKKANKRRL